MTDYRRKVVCISIDLLTAMMTAGAETTIRCIEGLPADAKLIRVGLDGAWNKNEIALLFEHPSFEPVAEGQTYPILMPRFETVQAVQP